MVHLPVHASWPNRVPFGIIEHQAIRRGTFRSVKDLKAKIRTFTITEATTAPPIRLD